jgi:hypothetical protein
MNSRDIESCEMKGRAVFEEWRAEFEAEFFKPVIIDGMRKVFAQMRPEQLEALRAMAPEEFDRMQERIQGGNYG